MKDTIATQREGQSRLKLSIDTNVVVCCVFRVWCCLLALPNQTRFKIPNHNYDIYVRMVAEVAEVAEVAHVNMCFFKFTLDTSFDAS